MDKKKRIRLRGEPLVIPKLAVPKRIRSRRQYVRWTKLCRDWLVKYHGYPADSFIRIADTEPTLNYTARYPIHWQSIWRYRAPRWSGHLEKMPRNAIVWWPDGVDISSEAYDPRCPLYMLEEIQHWTEYRYEEELEGLCGCCGGNGHLRLAPVQNALHGDTAPSPGGNAFGVATEV